MDLSIVIPLLNESDSLQELHDWVVSVVNKEKLQYEIWFIDDGSTDDSWNIITKLASQNPCVKGVCFTQNYGKSQALHIGFKKALGVVVITMDADLQDSPDEIPALYQMIQAKGYDLVSGWKKIRHDAVLSKNLPSKLFNAVARLTSGVQLHDFNCGIKAYHKDVIKNIQVHGEMHRYIPVLAKNAGFSKIGEHIVTHYPRKYGVTKFGMSRFVYGFLDLITIFFIGKFSKRPMHFFGGVGTILFLVGFGFAFYLGIDKLCFHPNGRLIAMRPEFYIALTTMILGTQFFLAGFLGEMLVQQKAHKGFYTIKSTLS